MKLFATLGWFLFLLVIQTARAAEPVIVEFRLAGDPAKALVAQRDGPMEVSDKRASKFRIVPGLTDNSLVSLELVGAKDYFVRHFKGVIKVNERPKKPNQLFDADATWKMTKLGEGKVRFESSNYRGDIIMIGDNGFVIKRRDAPMEKSVFEMKDK